MADTSTDDPAAPPEGWDAPDAPEPTQIPMSSPEGDALIDDLAALREQRAAEHDHEMALPGFGERLWARYKLLGPKRVSSMMVAFADDSLKDNALTYRAAKFLSDAVEDLWMRVGEGARIDFPGFDETNPPTFTDLPAKLVPPRPAGRPHDGPSAVRALFARDSVLVGHALDVAGWMQSADARVAEAFSGESEGGPR